MDVPVCLFEFWLHFAFWPRKKVNRGRPRNASVGAVFHPAGTVVNKLLGSYLTSTWISFGGRNEGESLMRPEGRKLFQRK